MNKLLDRVWEWMKSTAWFQVVLLVGVVVAIVLCIQPITTGISGAVNNAKRVKYFENNRISFDEMIDKIDNIENGGEEFAVIFGNPADSTLTSIEEGVRNYSESENAVKIYVLDTNVCYDNRNTYNSDENWYNYYTLTAEELQDVATAAFLTPETNDSVYENWKIYTGEVGGSQEVSQLDTSAPSTTDSVPSIITNGALMWFRRSENIDPSIQRASTVADPVNDELDANYNFHIAKIYLTISDPNSSATSDAGKVYSGLTKFFTSSLMTY